MAQVYQSVEMLNYVSTLSERIKENKSNRLELNQISDEIYNNIIFSSIDERTQSLITGDGGFLYAIHSYELMGLQRERLEYVAEKQKSQALRAAMPNPIYVLSVVQSSNPIKAVISVVATTAGSILNYEAAKDNLELQNMLQTWELEDNERDTFNKQKDSTYNYMIDVSRGNNLPNEYTLSMDNILDFVKLQTDENASRRKAELEKDDNRNLYLGAKYGPYYLLLANTYYELEEYQKCIDIFEDYENRGGRIFRHDYDAARVIPKVIYSAKQVYNKKKYITAANKYLNLLKNETTDKNWELRYFAALAYIDLAEIDSSNHNSYFKKAADILLSNISYLSKEQDSMLKRYAEPVNESIAKDVVRAQDKKATKELIKQEKEDRKTALPPFYEPLLLNCELLNSVRIEYKITDSDWNSKFIKVTENSILNLPARNSYGFYSPASNVTDLFSEKYKSVNNIFIQTIGGQYVLDCNIVQAGLQKITNDYAITLPATLLEENSKISIKLQNSVDNTNVVLINLPYKIKNISRPKQKELKTSYDVAAFINEFTADIVLDLKGYEVKFSDFDQAIITVESYDKKLSIFTKKSK